MNNLLKLNYKQKIIKINYSFIYLYIKNQEKSLVISLFVHNCDWHWSIKNLSFVIANIQIYK